MGMRATVTSEIGSRVVAEIGRMNNLPSPRYVEEKYGCYLTAKDIKKWNEMNTEVHMRINERLSNGDRTMSYDEHMFLVVSDLILEDARDYISDVSYKCKLKGKERRKYLQKKTKEYRLYFG